MCSASEHPTSHATVHKARAVGKIQFVRRISADELCDDLMAHTFSCDACINGLEENCPEFRSLRLQIAQAGGPTKGASLTM